MEEKQKKMNKEINLKGKKGITLIALVITIIVLLILAGVTVATLTGDNGLLQKAESSKQANDEAKELELIKLAVSAAQVTGKGTIITENLNNELRESFNDNDITVNDIPDGWKYNSFLIYKDGTVEECKEGELPSSYQKVEYIESSGTQYIDTGVYYQEGTPKHKQIEINCAVISGSGYIWGVGNAWGRNRLLLYTDTNWRFINHQGNAGCENKDSGIAVSNNKTNIKLIGANLYIDNVKFALNNNINAMIKYTSGNTIPIFGKHNNSGYTCFNGNLRVYSFTIKSGDGSSIIRDMVPCYRKVDNKKGMYDIVNYKFYPNQGSGDDFTAGPEV